MNDARPTIGINTDAGNQLRNLIERIERLEEEKSTIAGDIREVYAEAKANGFDTRVMRQVVRLRAMDAGERQEQEAIRDLYMHALGMTPIEEHVDAAAKAAERFVDSVAQAGGGSVTADGRTVDIPAKGKRKAKAEAAT